MLWYVAFIALVNLGLGYALATYLGSPGRTRGGAWPSFPWPASGDPTPSYENEAVTDSATARRPDRIAAEVKPVDLDTSAEPVTREYAERVLNELSQASRGRACAALVEVNWASQAGVDLWKRLLRGVAGTVRQLFRSGETVVHYSDRQFLLVLPDSSADEAAQRVERLRQTVEKSTYVADGIQWPVTVTCALSDVGCDAARLLDLLDETLAEARRYGGNRTFMHDGFSPTPVVPLDLSLAVQECTI